LGINLTTPVVKLTKPGKPRPIPTISKFSFRDQFSTSLNKSTILLNTILAFSLAGVSLISCFKILPSSETAAAIIVVPPKSKPIPIFSTNLDLLSKSYKSINLIL